MLPGSLLPHCSSTTSRYAGLPSCKFEELLSHTVPDSNYARLDISTGSSLNNRRRVAGSVLRRAMGTSVITREDSEIQAAECAEPEALVSQDVAEDLLPEALVWAALNGLVIGDKTIENSGKLGGVGIIHLPFSLVPTPFPAKAFEQAVELAPLFNQLIDKVSLDAEFMRSALAQTQKADDFTARLLKVHRTILDEGVKQDIRLGLSRSDYLLDQATENLLQVELNTVSCSFSGVAAVTTNLHKHIISQLEGSTRLNASRVPENNVTDGFARALAMTWQEVGNRNAVVLMVVQKQEWNRYDQYLQSFRLEQLYGVRTIRRTLAEVHAQGKITADGTLVVDGFEVSIVYYRAGYNPNDYPTEVEWDARLLMERSSAVKCPSISYQLVGSKKMQQELASPGVLERFFTDDKEAVSKLRSSFAGLWGLEDAGSGSIIQKAIREPHGFVLKPQREGGGNNSYGDDIANKLRELVADGGDGLAAYILMQRIFPVVNTSYLVRKGVYSAATTVSEVGIFGVYLQNGDRVILNEQAGYMVRTKASDMNEGGVTTGFAFIDSPYLI